MRADNSARKQLNQSDGQANQGGQHPGSDTEDDEYQPVKPRVYPVEPRFDPAHSRAGLLGMAFQTSQATRSFTCTISTNGNTPVSASRVVSVLIPYSELYRT